MINGTSSVGGEENYGSITEDSCDMSQLWDLGYVDATKPERPSFTWIKSELSSLMTFQEPQMTAPSWKGTIQSSERLQMVRFLSMGNSTHAHLI